MDSPIIAGRSSKRTENSLPVESKPSTKRDNKEDAIRKAAYACFAKHGYFGSSVDMICAEAGISKGTFYWYFESKQALFLNILDHWANEVERQMNAQFEGALTSPDVFPAMTQALIREARRGRAIMPLWLEFLSQAGRNPEMKAAIANFHGRIRAVIARLLAPAFSQLGSEEETQALAGTILAAFIGLVAQDLDESSGSRFETNAQMAMTIIQKIVVPKPV